MSRAHNEHLAKLVEKFENALAEAEAYAKEHDLSFSIEPSYGMGGRFLKVESEWQAEATGMDIGEYGWYASSMSC